MSPRIRFMTGEPMQWQKPLFSMRFVALKMARIFWTSEGDPLGQGHYQYHWKKNVRVYCLLLKVSERKIPRFRFRLTRPNLPSFAMLRQWEFSMPMTSLHYAP